MKEMPKHTPARTRVFDWEKAARLIVFFWPQEATAGMYDERDEAVWRCTSGPIWLDCAPATVDQMHGMYLASIWATPILVMTDHDWDTDLQVECWVWQDEYPEWDAMTRWPDRALAIIEEGQGRWSKEDFERAEEEVARFRELFADEPEKDQP
jgi:hypothetical protein